MNTPDTELWDSTGYKLTPDEVKVIERMQNGTPDTEWRDIDKMINTMPFAGNRQQYREWLFSLLSSQQAHYRERVEKIDFYGWDESTQKAIKTKILATLTDDKNTL